MTIRPASSTGRCNTICYNLFTKGVFYEARKTVKLSALQRTEMWSRWKLGHRCMRLGGPSARTMESLTLCCRSTAGCSCRASSLATNLTLAERENISEGLLRVRRFVRSPKRCSGLLSTVSREGRPPMAGRPLYRANEADHQAWDSALRPRSAFLPSA